MKGLGVSPGIAMGEASLSRRVIFTSRREPIEPRHVDEEMKRLGKAFARTRKQLGELKEKIQAGMGEEHAFIFDAHLLILEDPSLVGSLEKIIREDAVRAEWALSRINAKYESVFESLNDEYFRQRKSDVSDVLAKVYRNLEKIKEKTPDPGKRQVLVAHELLPSEAALSLSRETVLGVALDVGGSTSHTAILARSLNIPAVVGLRDVTQWVKNGDYVIIDGTVGEVMINPPQAVRREYLSKRDKYDAYRNELRKTAKLKSETLDGVSFSSLANIELPEEASQALSLGAEGIGLFRSEFIYLQSLTAPTEEDHFACYSSIARTFHPYPVCIRTIDIGGEKSIPQLNIEKEPNPALGLRGIRFSLRNRDMFRLQLRAILRASAGKNVRVIIPMVTEIEELNEVKAIFEEVKDDLRRKNTRFDDDIPLGVMIEVPAAAAMADVLVRETDFLSIGTNDLIQYYLAVDRSNEFVSYLYKPLHPAVLRLIRDVIQAAGRAGKNVTICGEMAADPLTAMVLLGLGMREFSMNPIFIPKVKKALRSVDTATLETACRNALDFGSAQEIEEFIIECVLARHPDAFLMSGNNNATNRK